MDSDGSIDIKPREGVARQATGEGITITPAIFEQLYLAPQNRVEGNLRQTYGNPTPIALAGFCMCATPVSMALLGWKGAGGFMVAAHVGSFFGFGAMLLFLGAVGEWILGNTFPATIFGTFSAFWITFAVTVVPDSGAYSTYSTTGVAADGMGEPQFYSTFAYFFICMAILNSTYLVASVRTNVAFFSIFLMLVPSCCCLAASFFAVSEGKMSDAESYQHAGAGLLFACSLLGWYIFISQTLASVEFPLCLPMGDLSTIVPSISKRLNRRNKTAEEAV